MQVTAEVLALLQSGGVPKGDALAVARIAGIQAAKRTSDLVPLCHPVAVHGVVVDLQVREDHVAITATVRTADRTGVEMEALTSVAVAALTLVDMVKAVDPAATILEVAVVGEDRWAQGHLAPDGGVAVAPGRDGAGTALVVTVSTRAAAGVYPDRSGPALVAGLVELGLVVTGPLVVPDGDAVEAGHCARRSGTDTTSSSPLAAPGSPPATTPRR